MPPLKVVAENLSAASANVVEAGNAAREQFGRVEAMVSETGEALHTQLDRLERMSNDVVDRVGETAEIVQASVIRPIREVAALAKGLSHGLRTLLAHQDRSRVDQARQDEELFI